MSISENLNLHKCYDFNSVVNQRSTLVYSQSKNFSYILQVNNEVVFKTSSSVCLFFQQDFLKKQLSVVYIVKQIIVYNGKNYNVIFLVPEF